MHLSRRQLLAGASATLVTSSAKANFFSPGATLSRGPLAPAAGGAGLVLIDRTTGTNIGNMGAGGNLAASFNGVTSQTGAASSGRNSVTNAYIGKTLAAAKVFGRAVVHGSSDAGFVAGTPSVTLTIYGKDGAAPSAFNDGTVLVTSTFSDTQDESAGRTLDSTDLVNNWDHVWVALETGASTNLRIAELVLYEWA